MELEIRHVVPGSLCRVVVGVFKHHSIKPASLRVCSVLGSSGFQARGKMFEVKSTSGKLLFSADEQEVVVGAERLRVMGE